MKKKRSATLFSRPFHSYFYYLAIIACLLISVVLLFLFKHEADLKKAHAANEKLQLIVGDLENNLDLYEDIAIKLSTSTNFHPEMLSHNKYHDTVLLGEFGYYHNTSPLSEEMILFYSEKDYLFRSSGYTTDLNVYLDSFSGKDREALSQVMDVRQTTDQYLFLSDKLILLKPLKLYSAQSQHQALLGFVIPEDRLWSRFEMVSGGLDGSLSLYCRDALLFTNGTKVGASPADPYFATTSDQVFRVTYRPASTGFLSVSDLLVYFLLLFLVWGVVMVLATLLTRKARSTLLAIPNKYRDRISDTGAQNSEDILSQIQSMIDRLLVNNAEIRVQMQTKQAVLRDQIVYNLVHGDVTYDAASLLEEHLDLPGPCFYAGCIAFPPEAKAEEAQYEKLVRALADLTNEETNEYVYAIYERKSGLVNFICSSTDEQKSSLCDCIYEIADGYGDDVAVSIGPICCDLSGIHHSWLRSNDLLYAENASDGIDFANIAYDTNIQHMLSSIAEGNGDAAIQSFNAFFTSVDEAKKSVLLMQKIYIQFANELVTLSNSQRIELDYQAVHALITTKEHTQFIRHAHELLRSICDERKNQMTGTRSSANTLILDYIRDHFADYDISIEKVAQETDTSPSIVRSVVRQESGFLYRDYIVHLRLEYAKKLLLETRLNVSDICEKVGYANASYFVRTFRENTGLTPSKFRQINGGS
jgi:AraC-like DNA-binding protein